MNGLKPVRSEYALERQNATFPLTLTLSLRERENRFALSATRTFFTLCRLKARVFSEIIYELLSKLSTTTGFEIGRNQ